MSPPAPHVPRILIADDQEDVLAALRLLLKGEGYRFAAADSPAKALRLLEEEEFDAALIDLNYARDTTSGKEGLDLLTRIQALDVTLPVVVMTAYANVELAVEAMRRGARDFVPKPWDNQRLASILRNQLELSSALRLNRRLQAENESLRQPRAQSFIAESPAMREVMELIERVGPSETAVLITGENGTGKNVIAKFIHAESPRADKAFVTVNMGGLSEGVFESELFGHVKGAFTDAKTDRVGRFELADGGTLFLDEIANIPPHQQSRLLRVLETGEFERVGSSRTRFGDVRVLAATNADIAAEVEAGRFRRDLLFRLNTVTIHLPPLRERREDIEPLALMFLREHAGKYRKDIHGFAPAAFEALRRHAWPGNVRELNHALERAVLLCQTDRIQAADLGLGKTPGAAPSLDDMSLEEVEKHLIQRTLARFHGNARQAAESLGLSRSAFYRRLARYGL